MLARAMTSALRAHRETKRVLEVGPGTGPFTGAILRTLRSKDVFDLVELNGAFCKHLEETLLSDFRSRHSSITVRLHEAPIEKAPLEGEYDFVVCGLPFNNFPLALTQSIFAQLFRLMRDGGELTYFEYAGVRTLKRPFVGSSGRDHINRQDDFRRLTASRHHVTRQLVVANIPPAHAIRVIKRKETLESCSE